MSTGMTQLTPRIWSARFVFSLLVFWVSVTTSALSQPPNAPSNVVVVAVSNSLVHIQWKDSSNNEERFRIERKVGAFGFFDFRFNIGANNTFASDDVSPNTTYTYQIRAENSQGNSSFAVSNTVTTPEVPPNAPSNLQATLILDTRIDLTWSDNSLNETGFRIERKIDNGTFELLTTKSKDSNSHSDTGLLANMTYTYRISAENSVGRSAFSNEASATTTIFTRSVVLPGVTFGAVAWGDYDNDGDLDLLLTGNDSTLTPLAKLYQNNNGNFVDIGAPLEAVTSSAIAWGDYDNDGDLDILLAGRDGDPIARIYRNDGGSFLDIGVPLIGVSLGAVAWGDYDNDGDLDILLTGGQIPKIYRNEGASFVDIGAPLEGAGSAAAWGDYDNDGDLDILLTDFDSNSNDSSKVYRNDGGSFVNIRASLAGVRFSSVAWGDYDSDGDLDILLTGTDARRDDVTKVYRNDNGNFVDLGAPLTNASFGSATWGDYDNDGDLDVLLTGESNGEPFSKVYRNEGGNFVDISASLQQVRESTAAWGDYDNDGDLDILLAGTTDAGQYSVIYRNDVRIKNTAPIRPASLAFTLQGNTVTLNWNKSTDNQSASGGLTYNLRVGTTPGGAQIVSPMASITTGYRKIPKLGNTNHRNGWTIRNLPDGKYYWSVQAIDNSFAGSAFAVEQIFKIDNSAPLITPDPISPPSSGQSLPISARLTDNEGIKIARLYFRRGGATVFDSTAMAKISGDTYQGTISNSSITVRGVEYYIFTQDSAGNRTTFPPTNPEARPQVIPVMSSNLAFPDSTPAKVYRMISVPFDLNEKSPTSVLEDDLGRYDDSQWRLLRYALGANPPFVEFGKPGFVNFEPGVGFWLITKEKKPLDAGAGKSVTTAQNYGISLQPGWNQIGNPFTFTVNWSDVIKNNNVENRLVGYGGSTNDERGYDYTRTQLVPFEGYFVNNKGLNPTTIEIPTKAATRTAEKSGTGLQMLGNLQKNEWALQITATCDRYLDKDNYIGCLNDASDEWDTNDFSEAPFFDQHVALYFPHPEWKKYPDLYTGDFRETKAEGDYWDFVVKSEVAKSEVGRSEVAKSEVVLRLAEVQNLPADWEIILLDKTSRVAINFSEKKQYSFPSGGGKSVREFRVVVGKKDFVETNNLNLSGVPQAFALGQNYPNPFSANGTFGNPSTRIDYELPATSHVKISVYNLSGQLVFMLFDGEQSAGRYTVSWDGANSFGNRVASGVYLVRMEASDFTMLSGKVFMAVRKVLLAK